MLRRLEDAKISVDDVQNIHQLPLVFMYSFDLDIIKRVQRYLNASVFFDPALKPCFVLLFDGDELLQELSV
jgi:hypothetical protein